MRRPRLLSIGLLLPLLLAAWLVVAQAAASAENESATAVTRADVATRAAHEKASAWDAPGGPLEERLFSDAADGRLDAFSPLAVALVAGGIDNGQDLDRYVQKAAALADQLRQSGPLPTAPRDRAEAIFSFLHRRVLRGGYDLACTDLRRAFDDGRFNCVSATVLFNYFAEQLGVPCCGLEMPGHAMSRVSLPGAPLDIETTCPRWFFLNAETPRRDSASPTVGPAMSADRSKAREVSPIQLAAMIYYNRGVDLLAAKQFEAAARANAKAVRLDPQNGTARGNLLATLNNWAIELGNAGQFSEAVALLRQGLAIDPKFDPCSQNFVHIHRQWVDDLCRRRRFDDAIEILGRAAAEMPDRDYLRKAQSEVRQRSAQAIAASPEHPR